MSWNFENATGVGGGSANPTGQNPFPGGENPFEWSGAESQPTTPQAGPGWDTTVIGDPQPGTGGWPNSGDIWDPNADAGLPVMLPAGKPPVPWFAGAAAGAVLALAGALVAAFVLDGSLPVAAVSWLLAGPVAVLVLGEFVKRDERQRARASYEGPWVRPATIAVGVVALLAVVASAYVIANWVATR